MEIISISDFENLVLIACEENDVDSLIKLHKKLINSRIKIDEHSQNTYDGAIYFINKIFQRNSEKRSLFYYSNSENEFIKSSYLSNYFKICIKKLLEESPNERLNNILNSDQDINEMEEEEIKLIKDSIDAFYFNSDCKGVANIAILFMTYLYKLDGKGVTSYIKHNIPANDVAYKIMFDSGINPNAKYYSGRGVTLSDLNSDILNEVFNQLFILDKEFALDFVRMVNDMKTLGATEFIEEFYLLTENKFKQFNNSNASLREFNHGNQLIISFATTMSKMQSPDINEQIRLSNDIKKDFLKSIRKKLEEIDKNNEFITKKITSSKSL